MVLGNCSPLDGRPQKEVKVGQAVGGSFLLLPRRHALSSRCLWTFNHNTCENRLEKVQGAATSPFFTPPLFQDTWPYVQLLWAERNAPCQRDLAIDKAKPPASAAEWQWSDRSAVSGRKALSPPGPMSYLRGLGLRIWTLFWRREGSAGMDMRNTPMVLFTYRLRESVGMGCPKWHGSCCQRRIAESGSSWLSTIMKTYLEIWCEIYHACSKPTVWKGISGGGEGRRRGHWCGCSPCTCTLIQNSIILYDIPLGSKLATTRGLLAPSDL